MGLKVGHDEQIFGQIWKSNFGGFSHEMASGEGFGHVFSAKSCAVARHFNQKWLVELR